MFLDPNFQLQDTPPITFCHENANLLPRRYVTSFIMFQYLT